LADKPQQQTLSVRISEALRQRLERARKLMASTTGESVSTSEIAKQLLESAREDRLEVVELLSEPTKSLVEIRRKGEAQRLLSKAEWTVLAYYVQQGLEAYSEDTPTPISRESLISVLDAFLAVYEIRKGPFTGDDYYLGNLPYECRPAKGKASESSEKVTPDVVRRTVVETRRQVSDPATKWEPTMAGRNLYVLLGDEAVRDTEILNRSFARGAGNDFSILLSFPGARAPQYPFGEYPVIAEFRRMLAALDPAGSIDHWKAKHFFGYLAQPDKDTEFAFRARNNGITFTFSEKEWKSVRELFRRAWEIPDVRIAWDGLTLEYGEL